MIIIIIHIGDPGKMDFSFTFSFTHQKNRLISLKLEIVAFTVQSYMNTVVSHCRKVDIHIDSQDYICFVFFKIRQNLITSRAIF